MYTIIGLNKVRLHSHPTHRIPGCAPTSYLDIDGGSGGTVRGSTGGGGGGDGSGGGGRVATLPVIARLPAGSATLSLVMELRKKHCEAPPAVAGA
jgi:hypothetical protein